MKKIIFLGYFLFLFTLIGYSQFYFRFGGGAGLGFPYDDPTFYSHKGITVTPVNAALGKGVSANIALQWMIGKYIGTELAIKGFYGSSVYKNDLYKMSAWFVYEETRWGMMMQFIPSLIITPGFQKVNPYVRLGLIIGAVTKVYQKSWLYTISSYGLKVLEDNFYYGGIAPGFTFDLGVDLRLNSIMTFYSELDFNLIRYSPKFGTYEDTDPNYDQVKNDLKNIRLSFSNVEFSFGLKFFLGK